LFTLWLEMLTPGLEPVELQQTPQAGLGAYQEILLLIGPTATGTQQQGLLQLPLEIVLRLKKGSLEAGTMLDVERYYNMFVKSQLFHAVQPQQPQLLPQQAHLPLLQPQQQHQQLQQHQHLPLPLQQQQHVINVLIHGVTLKNIATDFLLKERFGLLLRLLVREMVDIL